MVIIGLDESGNFENREEQFTFIGGIVSVNNNDLKIIDDFLHLTHEKIKEEFSLFNYEYPQLLHSTVKKGITPSLNWEINTFILNEFETFLKENPHFKLSLFIKDEMSKVTYFPKSNLDDTNDISNTYTLMATKFLYNNIIYNFREDYEFELNLATRTVFIDTEEELQKYIKKGYQYEIISGNRYKIKMTNGDTYRGTLFEKMSSLDTSKKYKLSLNSKSINYHKGGKSNPYLYLADIACAYMRRNVKNFISKNPIKLIDSIKNKTGCDLELFYDTDAHILWTKIITAYKKGKLIDTLKACYELSILKDAKKDFYMEVWVSKVLDTIHNIFKETEFEIYSSEIEYLLSTDGQEYEKAFYIIENLEKVIEKISTLNKGLKNKTHLEFTLLSRKLSGYNHRGDIDNALETFEKIESLKTNISVEEYINVLNRSTNIEMNILDFKTAIKKLEDTYTYYEYIREGYIETSKALGISNGKSNIEESMGKILSSLGQAHSFNKDFEKAVELFNKAISLFSGDSNDKKRIDGYKAHVYIETRNREAFIEYINSTYTKSDLLECLILALNKKRVNPFEIYLLLKSIYTFNLDNLNYEKFIEIIRDERVISSLNLNEHPGELITKYITLILLNKKASEKRAIAFFENHIDAIENSEFTIDLINANTKLLINRKVLEKTQKEISRNLSNKTVLEIKQLLNQYEFTKISFKDIIEESSSDKILSLLENQLIYTYK